MSRILYLILKLWWKIVGMPELPPKIKMPPHTSSLTGRSYSSISHRMYMSYVEGRTIEEIAKMYGFSEERVKHSIWLQYNR